MNKTAEAFYLAACISTCLALLLAIVSVYCVFKYRQERKDTSFKGVIWVDLAKSNTSEVKTFVFVKQHGEFVAFKVRVTQGEAK